MFSRIQRTIYREASQLWNGRTVLYLSTARTIQTFSSACMLFYSYDIIFSPFFCLLVFYIIHLQKPTFGILCISCNHQKLYLIIKFEICRYGFEIQILPKIRMKRHLAIQKMEVRTCRMSKPKNELQLLSYGLMMNTWRCLRIVLGRFLCLHGLQHLPKLSTNGILPSLVWLLFLNNLKTITGCWRKDCY